MKSVKPFLPLLLVLTISQAFAQKTISDYVSKNDPQKIEKAILIDALSQPATGKSFRDGHGKGPYLTSKDQLPKKVALVTFNIRDYGLTTVGYEGYYKITTVYSLTEGGGNLVASTMLNQTISNLRKKFAENGAELLTPDEFLDTEEKKSFYYDEFEPTVSKIGNFLEALENRTTDISVSADGYRYFDMGASLDYLRAESLGYDLAKKLDVDAVLSIGIFVQTQAKEAYVRSFQMALNAPNPIPKQDKKYVGQKTGTGYYNGQLFAGGSLALKKPIPSITISKGQITEMDFDGMEVIFDAFISKFYNVMYAAIEKTSK